MPEKIPEKRLKLRLTHLFLLGSIISNCSSVIAEQQLSTIETLQNHPQVQIWLDEKRRAESLSRAALGLPDPQITISLDNLPTDTFSFDDYLPTSKSIGLQQAIPNRAGRTAQRDKQLIMAELFQLKAEYSLNRLKAELQIAQRQLAANRAIKTILQQELVLYTALEDDLSGQIKAGSSKFARLSEVDIGRTDLHQKLNQLRADKSDIEARIIALLGYLPETRAIDPPKDYSASLYADFTLYPVTIALLETSIAQHDIKIADTTFKPNFGVQAVYKQREPSTQFAGDDWITLQASFSLPIWSKNNQIPRREAANANLQRATAQSDNVQRQWRATITRWQAQLQTTQENLGLIAEKQRSIKEIIATSKRNYEAGQTQLEQVLKSRLDALSLDEKWIMTQTERIRLNANLNSHYIHSNPDNR